MYKVNNSIRLSVMFYIPLENNKCAFSFLNCIKIIQCIEYCKEIIVSIDYYIVNVGINHSMMHTCILCM